MNKAINDMEQLTGKVKDITSVLKLQNENAEINDKNTAKLKEMSDKMDYIISQTISECPICYSPTSVKNSCCMSKCGHHMCASCYYKWTDVKGKNTCPMCRSDIFSKDSKLPDTLSRLNGVSHERLQILQDSLAYYDRIMAEKQRELDTLTVSVERVKHDLKFSARELNIVEAELSDRESILDEMDAYTKDINKWKKKHDKRMKHEISLARKKWRNSIKKVNKQVKERANIKKIANSAGLIKWHDSITPFIKLEMDRLRTVDTNIIKNDLNVNIKNADEEVIGWGDTILAQDDDIEMETRAELDLNNHIHMDTYSYRDEVYQPRARSRMGRWIDWIDDMETEDFE